MFGSRPVSMFPAYSHYPESPQPSGEERYYRQIADEHRRRSEAAARLAQQERERVARERELEALRERQYQQELARGARLRQQPRDRRPHSQLFGTSGLQSPFDFFGASDDQHPRARVAEERRRRQAYNEDADSRGFSNFLEQFFQHQKSEDEDEVPVTETAQFEAPPRPHSRPTYASTGSPSPRATEKEKQESSSAPTASQNTTPSTPATSTNPGPTTANSPKNHTSSFNSLDVIQTRFDTLKAGFSFPPTVEFYPSNSTFTHVPKLTYAAINVPVHEYENELVKLLTKLDAVESDGAESIRGARKALVIAVENELDRLDEQKREAWRKLQPTETETAASESPESESAPSPASEGRDHVSQLRSSGIAPSDSMEAESAPGPSPLPEEQCHISQSADFSPSLDEPAAVEEVAKDPLSVAASTPLPDSEDVELEVQPSDGYISMANATASPASVETTSAVSDTEALTEEATTLPKENSGVPMNADLTPRTSEATEQNSNLEDNERSSEEAGVVFDVQDSDSEVEPFIQVNEGFSTPFMGASEALPVEGSKDETPVGREEDDDDDDFEML